MEDSAVNEPPGCAPPLQDLSARMKNAQLLAASAGLFAGPAQSGGSRRGMERKKVPQPTARQDRYRVTKSG